MKPLIASCLMIGLKGPSLLREERDWIAREGAAGVILFRRNILSFRQLSALCLSLKALARQRVFPPYFFIGMDLEGGSADRLRHLPESRPWPSAAEMGRLPPDQVFHIARRKGALLKSLGIDINFAPVADILQKNSAVLKGRAFGAAKEEVTSRAGAYAAGLLEGGVWPCLKHFPGHGGTAGDSHISLPRDERGRLELKPQTEAFREILEAASAEGAAPGESGDSAARGGRRGREEAAGPHKPPAHGSAAGAAADRIAADRITAARRAPEPSTARAQRAARGGGAGEPCMPFVMTAHVEFPKIEAGPASFSRKFLRELLGGRLGFKGGIVSDDIDMGALAGFSPAERVSRALRAGCHLILCCQKPETPGRIAGFFKQNPGRAAQIQPFLREAFLRLSAVSRRRP